MSRRSAWAVCQRGAGHAGGLQSNPSSVRPLPARVGRGRGHRRRPDAATFAEAHLEISLFLSASPTNSDFALGRPTSTSATASRNGPSAQWPVLVVLPLFEERILPLANPVLLQRPPLRKPIDLLNAPMIQSTVSVVQ